MDKIDNRICFVEGRGDLGDLCAFIKSHQVENMVEIGSLAGISTAIFADYFDVLSIDPYIPGYAEGDPNSAGSRLKEAQKRFNILFANVDNVKQWKITSAEASQKIEDKSIDFVYIDACHTYESVREDIALWKPKIKDKGFIGGHDYAPKAWPGVVRAVDEAVKKPQIFNGSHWLSPVSDLR